MRQDAFNFETTPKEPASELESNAKPKATPKTKPQKKPQKKTIVEQPVKPAILTVTEAVSAARGLLKETFNNIYITGEISGLRPSQAGHLYFSLKDESSLLPAVIFRGVASKLPFQVEDGLEVVLKGTLDIYPGNGKFQIIGTHMEPKGVGALQLAFEQLKKKLTIEGLFNPEHKKTLPFLPKKIGVVTSATGAVIRDILNVACRRFPNIEVLISPSRVQGKGAELEIAEALKRLDSRGDCDVIIIARGGGSLEDLWCFNEEVVARAIFAATTPIVSAIGHEVDFTIADFVADLRAPTPSAAAEIVLPQKNELLTLLADRQGQLLRSLKKMSDQKLTLYESVRGRLKAPTGRFADLLQFIDGQRDRLRFSLNEKVIRGKRMRFSQLAGELNQLSPLGVLARGYTLLQKPKSGDLVRNATDLNEWDLVQAVLDKGRLDLRVEKILK
jgi:exodeoxyribonuclease VII large subunit